MVDPERDIETLRRLAEIWGGDLQRWPAQTRAWAAALQSDSQAQAVLEEARRLDARIEAQPDVSEARAAAVSGAVMGRLAAERTAPGGWSALLDRLLGPGGGFAAVASAGVALAIIAGAMAGAAAPIGSTAEYEIALALTGGGDALGGIIQ